MQKGRAEVKYFVKYYPLHELTEAMYVNEFLNVFLISIQLLSSYCLDVS